MDWGSGRRAAHAGLIADRRERRLVEVGVVQLRAGEVDVGVFARRRERRLLEVGLRQIRRGPERGFVFLSFLVVVSEYVHAEIDVGALALRRERRLLEVGLRQIRPMEFDLCAQPGGGVESEVVAEERERERTPLLPSSPVVVSEAFWKLAPVRDALPKSMPA